MRPGQVTMLLLACAVACGRPMFVSIGQVTLADADGVVAPEAGPVLELGPGADAPLPKIPAGAKVVQIAAARDLPYARVHELVQAVHAAGARPVLLVGQRGKVMALPHTVDAVAQSILLDANMEGDEAKACISPPAAVERVCTKRPGSAHVDRAFVRELVRDAVKGYQLTHVHVRPDGSLTWGDAVRAIDGARTCCGKDVAIAISLEDLAI